MNLLDFYFDTKVGLRNPSKTLELLSTISCWIFNVIGCIGAVASFIGIVAAWSNASPGFGLILGTIFGCLGAIVILALFKFLGWLSAFGLQCRAITLAAHEKFLNTDFAPVPDNQPAPSMPVMNTQPQPATVVKIPAKPAPIPKAPVKPEKTDMPKTTDTDRKPVFPAEPWTCAVCGAHIAGHTNICRRCGNPRTK